MISACSVAALVVLAQVASVAPAKPPTAEEARAFALRTDAELKRLWVRSSTAEWIKSTYITDDTERNAAAMNEDLMAFLTRAIKESLRFKGLKVDAQTERILYLLRVAQPLPAPLDAGKRAELAALAAKLEGLYGKGKACKPGYVRGTSAELDTRNCRDLSQLSEVLSKVADRRGPSPSELTEAWAGWHEVGKELRPLYERLVELSNEGAREIGAEDLGVLWRSAYDMTPAELEVSTDRLWGQVKPLYDELHCYARRRLGQRFGPAAVPPKGPLPAQLLGNMWGQEWTNLYPMLEPYSGQPSLDVDRALKRQGYDAVKLVKLAERFFTSLGLEPLPATFWERSQFTRPRDREVVCHASAWDVTYSNDLRIKMCIKVDEEDLITVHHELGHDYYYQSYNKNPVVLFQQGANDGFHEAIGDALTHSITPAYLKQLKLIDALPRDDKGLINVQMKQALKGVAFLPFGRLVDQWRWDVFSGKVKPSEYNQHWWALKLKYQGIAPPMSRGESFFDPGAKYHVAGNVPYLRYFLAGILQFQFHKALCDAAGFRGPLYECSVYGNAAAGAKLRAMLELGASRPWPEALETLTGQREMDASALLEYFAPLRRWLEDQNQGQQCGW
jgi:peptidyl-dipeptidase A